MTLPLQPRALRCRRLLGRSLRADAHREDRAAHWTHMKTCGLLRTNELRTGILN